MSVRQSSLLRAALATATFVFLPSLAAAQAAPAAAPALLKVGDMAPDFTVTWVTAAGKEAKPFKLSEHKGETVVLAFFPAARTRGCTVQLETYRDKYAELFKGGQKVTLVGVSVDADTALTSWARDAKFPFHLAADVDRKVGMAYGASAGTGMHKRHLYIIDPTGRISYVVQSFNVMSADAYTDLGAAVGKAAGAK
ncbi:MAG: redoxin domain-containing protein [Gemmatimonadetes bacterium]|nr:redoxin domain-containing protein [Gemmatimonadota bacterium]